MRLQPRHSHDAETALVREAVPDDVCGGPNRRREHQQGGGSQLCRQVWLHHVLRQARPEEAFELVHRLDRDTSGVLVFAKRRPALTQLQTEIRENRIRKRYFALLAGRLPKDKMFVDVALAKNVLQGGERMVTIDEDGKPSRSTFKVIERLRDATYVEVIIETGRTHQIRVHAQHLGHAVLGDDKYGDNAANQSAKKTFGLKRLFLHAAEFGFRVGEPARDYLFQAPLAPELATVLAAWSRE